MPVRQWPVVRQVLARKAAVEVAYAQRTLGPCEPRTRWILDDGGDRHLIRIFHYSVRWWRGMNIEVDGKRVLIVPKPVASHPQHEGTFQVGHGEMTAVFEWRPDWQWLLSIDLYRNGVSLTDGSSLQARRDAAPAPAGTLASLRHWKGDHMGKSTTGELGPGKLYAGPSRILSDEPVVF